MDRIVGRIDSRVRGKGERTSNPESISTSRLNKPTDESRFPLEFPPKFGPEVALKIPPRPCLPIYLTSAAPFLFVPRFLLIPTSGTRIQFPTVRRRSRRGIKAERGKMRLSKIRCTSYRGSRAGEPSALIILAHRGRL